MKKNIICVLDASVAVKWFAADEIDSDIADAVLDNGENFIVPRHFQVEVYNVLIRYAARGQVEERELSGMLGSFEGLELFTYVPTEDLLPAAWPLACALRHGIYDCLYLALAEASGFPFVSADEKFVRKIREAGFAAKYRDLVLTLKEIA